MLYELLQNNIANIIRGDFRCNMDAQQLLSRDEDGKADNGTKMAFSPLTFQLSNGMVNYGEFKEIYNYESFYKNPFDAYNERTFACLLKTGRKHNIVLVFTYENMFEPIGTFRAMINDSGAW